MSEPLLTSYATPEGRFDELLAAPHTPRPHWAGLFSELLATPPGLIRDRLAAVERQIRESGVTYNVYADAQGLDRPWGLDVLPFIVAPEEWAELEAGIAQRAELLNRILADLYGPQTLLREGLIPSGLIFGHSGFLRPAHGAQVPGGRHLFVYAVDLARSPDGRWWVMADRTQAPSGAGYALENRLIISRLFPQLFRDLHVHHLAGFFAQLRDSLMHFAPAGDGPTLTVVLTPGPFNETYFEHAFLARYLGFPLVEGGDLIVREGKVWLKTIEGLKRVHAILRRQDDAFCDPLELRHDSALGIAGLTDCVRRGTVLVANSLGAGVLESGALLGFLPRLAERLLGEPLKLPSIATWWCGEPAALEDALGRVESLVFKPADPASPFEPVFGMDLDEDWQVDFRQHITQFPERFVAQELVRVSQAPVLAKEQPKQLQPRGIGLRVFATATPGGYSVMPGGLTRVAATSDPRVVTMQRGGGSKDTWVRSPGPVDTQLTLLRDSVRARDLVHSGAAIPSRVAEDLYWFGRYSERCEDAARLLRLALSPSFQDRPDALEPPVFTLAGAFGIPMDEDIDASLLDATTNDAQPFGLAANLRQLARVAFTLRERLSLDNWRSINRLIQDPVFGRTPSLSEALHFLDRTVTGLITLSGFALDGMTRDAGWRFLSIGRRSERLAFLCLALRVAMRENHATDLNWLLELADSIITYRARYMARPQWLPLLDLLVLDGTNPRSVIFQVSGMHDFLRRLEEAHGPCGREIVAPGLDALRELDIDRDLHPESQRLQDTLASLRSTVWSVHDRLTQRFFSHAEERSRATMAL